MTYHTRRSTYPPSARHPLLFSEWPTWLSRSLASGWLLVLLGAFAAGTDLTDRLAGQSVSQQDRSAGGMVSAGHPLAVDAGVMMLEMGGNAADAAVATAFALVVVEPTMSSIGGRAQVLVRLSNGEFRGIDATTQAPWDYDYNSAPQAAYGYPVIGVPGTVAGLLRLHEEHGSLPLAEVMAPAIDYAANGFRLLPQEARRQASGLAQAIEFPGTVDAYYHGDSTAHRPGEMLVQADHAATLRRIVAGGRPAFYRGEIAENMASDLAIHGSAVTLEAFHEYQAMDSRVVRGSYRGYELIGTDVPAAGVLAIQALQVMENFDPRSMSEAEWFAVVGQSLGLAAGELRRLGTDTAAARATSKEWARELAQDIMGPRQSSGRMASSASKPRASSTVAPTTETTLGPAPGTVPDLNGHTTHLSTADATGMSVALTQTLGPNMGSKVVTPGLGFLYASTLGGYLGPMEPGERARSNICPFMVVKDGEVVLVLGAAGGRMIPPAVVHAITRVIDFGMSLPEALAAPRVAGTANGIVAETSPGVGWDESELAEMRNMGLQVLEVDRSGAFGRVHGVSFDPPSKVWTGAADPDWEGAARGPLVTSGPPGAGNGSLEFR